MNELITDIIDESEMLDEGHHWLEYCHWCKHKHRVMLQTCPSCGIHMTPQPVSDKVREKCGATYSCDGCIAYEDHLR